jgi:hypothetical protein
MRFRRYLSKPGVALATVVVCVPLYAVQAADPPRSKGRPIEVSEPKNGMGSTNVNQMGTAKMELKNLEDDITKPLQSFSSKGSLDGMMAEPFEPFEPVAARVIIPSRRTRELLEQRRNWAFATPGDLVSDLTPEDVFNLQDEGTDGEAGSKASAIERYYERLSGPGHKTTSSYLNKDIFGSRKLAGEWDDPSATDNSIPLPGVSGNAEWSLRKLFDPAPDSSTFTLNSSGFSDIFGFNTDNSATSERIRAQQAQQKQLEEFKKIWDIQPASPAATASPVTDSMRQTPVSPGGLDILSLTGQHKPAGSASGTPDTTSTYGVPAQPSFAPVLPTATPVNNVPPQPTFIAPRRQF